MPSHICNSVEMRQLKAVLAVSLLSETRRGFNSTIIINGHLFAYPDCTLGVSVEPSKYKAAVITNPIILKRFYLFERMFHILVRLCFGPAPETDFSYSLGIAFPLSSDSSPI